MTDIILPASERRLLADVTAIHATKQREQAVQVEYVSTVYGILPATTWASYQAMTNLPE